MGKIKVEILTVDDTKLQIYLMPNVFNLDYGTHGILENNKYFENIKSGEFVIPTDWHIIISYNPSIYQGIVSISTVVEEYVLAD